MTRSFIITNSHTLKDVGWGYIKLFPKFQVLEDQLLLDKLLSGNLKIVETLELKFQK